MPTRSTHALRAVADGLRRRARTARRLRRDMGARVIAYVWASRLLPRRLGRVEWFTVMEYPCEPRRDAPDGMSYRWAGREDAPMLTAFGLSLAEVESRMGVGDRAMLCVDASGALLAYAWYRLAVWDEAGVEFVLSHDEAWAYDFDVAETVQGRRLLGHIGRAGAAALADDGITRIVGGVDVANRGVYRAFQRRGGTDLGCIAMARLGRVSVRREAWSGDPAARWSLYRGRSAVGLPVGDAPAPVLWRHTPTPEAARS